MTTKLISLNEYRINLTKIWKESRKNNIRYIVMVHSEAVFEVKPILGNEIPDDFDIGFNVFPENELTPEIKEKINKTMNKSLKELNNI